MSLEIDKEEELATDILKPSKRIKILKGKFWNALWAFSFKC